MITHCEATLTMCRVIEKGKSFLRREGYLFPAVYALTKDKPLGPEVDYPCVVNANCDEYPNDLGIYKTIVALRSQIHEGKSTTQFVAEMIARKHSPDIVGVFLMGLYKKVPRDQIKGTSLQMDPNATHVLHACFYQRGNKTPMMMVLPYLNRGPIDKDKLDPMENDPDEKGPYNVGFMSMPWTTDTKEFKPLLDYPFSEP